MSAEKHSNGNLIPCDQCEYKIVPLTETDTEKVLAFLRKFFFRDEPLNIAVGLANEKYSCDKLEAYCKQNIPSGLSIAAVIPNGELVGVCLNNYMLREEASDDKGKSPQEEMGFDKIMRLLTALKSQSDVFSHFPEIDKLLDIVIVSVDDSYRGLGICKALIEKTKQMAKQHGVKLIKIDCSSHFSAKAASRLGFQCIHTIQYEDFKNEDGTPVFLPKLPHTCAKCFLMMV